MTKYLLNRLLRGLCSVIIVVAIVMILIYSCLDRNQIFATDSNYSKMKSNAKQTYKMQQWEKYGYLDYVPYADWLKTLLQSGEITQETYNEAVKFGDTESEDSAIVTEYLAKFEEYYENLEKEYTIEWNDKVWEDVNFGYVTLDAYSVG